MTFIAPLHNEFNSGWLMTSLDVGWTAGFLEGEGCFYMQSDGRNSYPAISANQVQREPLDHLQKMFGGHVYYRQEHVRRQAIWSWRLTGPQARGLMMSLYAFMSPRRKEKIRELLDLWNPKRVRRLAAL